MTRNTSTTRRDICQEVTDRILAALESGTRPWARPWKDGQGSAGSNGRPLRSCGTPYRGVNILILWSTAAAQGYHNRFWLTFKQAQALGACVRKGETGTQVVYAGAIVRPVDGAEPGEADEQRIPFLRGYYVFNAEQIDGLPAKYIRAPAPLPTVERDAAAEAFFSATGANVSHGGDRAYYMHGVDRVQMPMVEAFTDLAAYYRVLAHELVHWSGAKHRLDRNLGKGRFGNPEYAFEELVAELGSAYVNAELGLGSEDAMRDDHAPYLASWIHACKDNKRAIFSAASLATAALDYLAAFSAPVEAIGEPDDLAEAA